VPLRTTSCRKLFSVSLVEPHQIAKKHLKLLLSAEQSFRITESDPQEPTVSGRLIPDVVVLSHFQSSRLPQYVRLIRQRNSDTKILVIESSLRPVRIASLLRSGVQGFVVDNEVDQDLLSAVRTMLDGRVWIRSEHLNSDKRGPSCDAPALQSSSPFTPHQQRVVDLVRERLSNKEIAVELGISERTVKFHLRNVFVSLGIDNRHALRDLLPAANCPAGQSGHNAQLPYTARQ